MSNIIKQAVENKNIDTIKKSPQTIKDYVKAMQSEISKALPSILTPERFSRIILSALSSTPKLNECTPQSFLGAMMNAAQLGLEPNTPLGQAYLIPFKNNKKNIMECQFQLGYKGIIDLAYRSGEIKSISAQVVYENDDFEYELGLDPVLKHKPARSERGNAIYFYAVFKTKNGGEGFEVMSVDDINQHAVKYSKSYKNGPWQTNFEEMAKKTVIKRVLKYAPLKTDFARAAAADETVKININDDMSIIPNDYIQTEYHDVDAETGEVIDENIMSGVDMDD